MSQSYNTIGGMYGHVMRRAVHMGMAIVPLIYYQWGSSIGAMLGQSREFIAILAAIIIVVFELVRLFFGITLYGQREHESRHISSFTWGAIAIVLVLLFAPSYRYGIPIIWSCAFADPMLGELRRLGFRTFEVLIAGFLVVAGLWSLCSLWLGFPWMWCFIMAPVIVASEWPSLHWIDDNAMMMLVPLAILIAVQFLIDFGYLSSFVL